MAKHPSSTARWLRRNGQGFLGLCIVGSVVIAAMFAPFISPRDPTQQNLKERLLAPSLTGRPGPSYPLGSDHLGRDVLSRILYGARISLLVASAAVACAGTTGVLLGLAAGYRGGGLEMAIVAVADAQLALPFVILAIAVAGTLGPSLANVIGVLVVTRWVIFARVTRAEVLSVSRREFIDAARSLGARDSHIVLRHVLPNVMPTAIVVATLQIARFIITESALSFLGVGVPVQTPTWGAMLSDGRNYLQQAPWIATFPGIALTVTVIGVNFLGSWFRELMNPWRTSR